MLAHGALLRKNFFTAAELIAIVKDFRNAGLPPEEVAMMALAQKVTTQANQVSEGDMDELRGMVFLMKKSSMLYWQPQCAISLARRLTY